MSRPTAVFLNLGQFLNLKCFSLNMMILFSVLLSTVQVLQTTECKMTLGSTQMNILL